jgi:hypothetical protein
MHIAQAHRSTWRSGPGTFRTRAAATGAGARLKCMWPQRPSSCLERQEPRPRRGQTTPPQPSPSPPRSEADPARLTTVGVVHTRACTRHESRMMRLGWPAALRGWTSVSPDSCGMKQSLAACLHGPQQCRAELASTNPRRAPGAAITNHSAGSRPGFRGIVSRRTAESSGFWRTRATAWPDVHSHGPGQCPGTRHHEPQRGQANLTPQPRAAHGEPLPRATVWPAE